MSTTRPGQHPQQEEPRPSEPEAARGDRQPKEVLVDPEAVSADPELPAFLARPQGAPVYHGFPLLEASRIDGWVFGVISNPYDENGCTDGDAFVQAPDGTRAGLVWDVGDFEVCEIVPPDPDRWGVYGVSFPEPIRTEEELVAAFHGLLPELQRLHAAATSGSP